MYVRTEQVPLMFVEYPRLVHVTRYHEPSKAGTANIPNFLGNCHAKHRAHRSHVAPLAVELEVEPPFAKVQAPGLVRAAVMLRSGVP